MEHFDLVVIGAGSGESVIGSGWADWQVALVDDGRVGFGGTCLNAGCIPSKMLAHTADLAAVPAASGKLGLVEELDAVRWPAVRDRVFGRTDGHSAETRQAFQDGAGEPTVIDGHARFTDRRTLDVDGRIVTADRFVVATGSRPRVPDLPGLADSGYVTSDDVMRLDRLPEHLTILGGGAVAVEFAHIFTDLGVQVTVLARDDVLLPSADHEVSALVTDLAARKWDVRLGRSARRVETAGGTCRVRLDGPDGAEVVETDVLLVAIGRVPNSDRLGADVAGIELRPDGLIVVDDHQSTTAEDVWALGDVSSARKLKHLANREARVVRHNLRNPSDLIATDRRAVPQAVFTSPQVAMVGRTEQSAREDGLDITVGRFSYRDIAYGWAMDDPAGFAKILADRHTGELLGAHVVGPQAANLIQPLIQAMAFGQDARRLAREQYWIHPAMSELIENALLDLEFADR